MSKWSMSDVFTMAIIVAYMAANANEQSEAAVQMKASLEPGFFYFLGYCICAIIAGQLMSLENRPST